jgi:hypothetical protein
MVQDRRIFQLSTTEAKRMRLGTYLFPVLVLPFAAIFALDSSKSQPAHFLLVMSIAVLLCAIVVAIGLAGASAQMRHAASTSLTIERDRLVWVSDAGTVETRFDEIENIKAFRRREIVHRVVVTLASGAEKRVEGLDDMQKFHEILILAKSNELKANRGNSEAAPSG